MTSYINPYLTTAEDTVKYLLLKINLDISCEADDLS